nr:trypsin-like peptidase domain-containing protein [Phytoactinopolyspora mesophila]
MVHATTCDGTGLGSAFLVSGNRIVTAAHVVDGAASVAVLNDGQAHQASLVGMDEEMDIAVIDTHAEIGGHHFDLAERDVEAGESLAVLGHPRGGPLTMTTGTAARAGEARWPHIQLNMDVSPGSSGAPVLRADGNVVGMLLALDLETEGLSYALRAELIAERLTEPDRLEIPEPAECELPLGPDHTELPDVELPGVEESADLHMTVVTTLAAYFSGINTGDYELAFDQLSPRLQDSMTMDEFAAALETSYDFGFEIHTIEETTDGAEVWLEFVSIQAPEHGPEGESCTNWSLIYELVWDDGWLLIDRVTGHDGTSGHTPCR